MSEMTDQRLADLERLGSRSVVVAVIIGVLLGPVGYVYAGQWRWAVINVFTLNYLMLGIVLVPIHVAAMILGAKVKVRRERSARDQPDHAPVADGGSSIARRVGRWYAARME